MEKTASEELYAALRAALDEIPTERRGREWLKTSVMVNCLFKREGGQTFAELRKLKRRSISAGFPLDDFVQKVFAVVHPWTLGPHGYKYSLRSRGSAATWQIVSEVGAFLEELGYQWFINSGTLLGVVRGNGFIPHDDDVDLAVVLPGNDIHSVMRKWIELRNLLASRELLGHEGKLIHFKLRWNGGLPIDLFPSWTTEERVFIFPHTGGEVGLSDVFPLRVHSIEGVEVKMPAAPEAILELNYGANWRIPDPTWHFDWVGARAKFPGLRAAFERAKGAAEHTSADADHADHGGE